MISQLRIFSFTRSITFDKENIFKEDAFVSKLRNPANTMFFFIIVVLDENILFCYCFKCKKKKLCLYILYVTQIFSALFTGRVSNHVETLAEIGFCIPVPSQRKGKKEREMSRLDLLHLEPGKRAYMREIVHSSCKDILEDFIG